jgi:hypothetical protein
MMTCSNPLLGPWHALHTNLSMADMGPHPSCHKGVMTYPPPPAAEEDEEEKPGDSYAGHMEHGKRQGHGK